jgi:DNA-binding CsgD family transcriptional regulator
VDSQRYIKQTDGHPEGGLEPAINQLISRLIESDVRHLGTIQTEEVILDIEVDGTRYLVIRCAVRSESPPAMESAPLPTAQSDAEPVAMDGSPSLSPRESEIARMVAKGYANKTIASVLDISTWTVSSHLRRIYSKFGVTSRAAMVARLFDRAGPPRARPEREGPVAENRTPPQDHTAIPFAKELLSHKF